MSRTVRKDYYNFGKKSLRDKKKWYKSPKAFKQARGRSRRAKEQQAVKLNKEVIPLFRKDNNWNWT